MRRGTRKRSSGDLSTQLLLPNSERARARVKEVRKVSKGSWAVLIMPAALMATVVVAYAATPPTPDDLDREARVSEPAPMPTWGEEAALGLSPMSAAELVLERDAAAEAAAWEVIVRAFPGVLSEWQMVLQCPTCGERRVSARAPSDPRIFALAPCAAHASVPKPMVETEVLVLCALCGRTEKLVRRVRQGTRNIVGYCSARQCQWTSELEQKHPDWGRATCVLIGQHKVRIGMTKEQVRESWGSPKRVNRSVYKFGTREQWVYERDYLYFRDGKLNSISVSR